MRSALMVFNNVEGEKKLGNNNVIFAEQLVIHKHQLALTNCRKRLELLCFGGSF